MDPPRSDLDPAFDPTLDPICSLPLDAGRTR
jgi:hypothetical protein